MRRKIISYDALIKEKIEKGEPSFDDLMTIIKYDIEYHLLKKANAKPKKIKNSEYAYQNETAKDNIDNCIEYVLTSDNIINKDEFVNFFVNLFHRIIYYNTSKHRDFPFLYDEYYNIVKNNSSEYYEKILDCLKKLKELDNNLDITPFIRELYDASEFFENTYLIGNIKLFSYQFAYELDPHLSNVEKATMENIVLKKVRSNEFTNENAIYTSALANYLYAGDVENADIDAHENVIVHEGEKEVLELFKQNVVVPAIRREFEKVRIKK